MQAILGLLPREAARAVQHLGRDLLADVGGEAVERDGLGVGELQEARVHPVRLEIAEALLARLLLTHARPDVRVHGVRAVDGLAGVGDERDAAAVRGRIRSGRGDEVGVRLVSGRGRRDELHPEASGNAHQRVADVVAVADVREPDAREAAEALAQRHRVGERLERVRLVGQAVDDGDRGVLRELLDLGLLEGADHERGEEAREDERRVAVRLAARKLELGRGQEERHAAELRDADLERHACPRRRLVEDEPDRAARQDAELGTPRALGLQLVREVEERLQILTRPAGDAREARSLQVGRGRRPPADATAARPRLPGR